MPRKRRTPRDGEESGQAGHNTSQPVTDLERLEVAQASSGRTQGRGPLVGPSPHGRGSLGHHAPPAFSSRPSTGVAGDAHSHPLNTSRDAAGGSGSGQAVEQRGNYSVLPQNVYRPYSEHHRDYASELIPTSGPSVATLCTSVTDHVSSLHLQEGQEESAPSSPIHVQPPPVSSKSLRFPLRPGKGRSGIKCVVKANHFFAELPDKDLHQYDVSHCFLVLGGKVGSRARRSVLVLVDKHTSHHAVF